ncbi:MAG: PD40 domain-containing protein [Phycisphaerales bacterium]|nr:PD40 domain-containing protein [Phycisphaerales bacterium]
MRSLVLAAGLGTSLSAAAASPTTSNDVTPHAGMLRYPDVSATHIVFVYANDLWMVPREGGEASPLASPPGPELFPRFSADGKTIAFMGNYDGNRDLYTLPVSGGIPARITHHPAAENLTDWTADGRLIFFAPGMVTIPRQTQLFTTSAAGGLPTQLPVPYGANGSISADGTWLAYTPHSTDTRTWKRYRGGMATDVWLFNLKDNTSKRITDWEGTDSQPMWHGATVYYMSDQGPEHRLNIWSYDTASGKRAQVTKITDYDVKWPSIGPGKGGKGEIIFQYGPQLSLVDLATGKISSIEVTIPGARPTLRPQAVDASKFITSMSISPTGKRAAIEARGDLWTGPAEKGSPRNLTRTSGVAERSPAWSPDGRWIAYFSDETGEYELYIKQSDGKGETSKLTDLKGEGGFKYNPVWSPDSKFIAFTDKTGSIWMHTKAQAAVEEKKDKDGKVTTEAKPAVEAATAVIDTDPWGNQPVLSWSHDSRFLAYPRGNDTNPGTAIWVFEREADKKHQLTSGMFNEAMPAFDRKGDYLYFTSARNFQPKYSDLDTTFVYSGTNVIHAVPLRTDTKSPWAPSSDEETWKDESKKDDDKKDEKKDGEKEGDKDDGDKNGNGDKPADDADKPKDNGNGDKKDDEKKDDQPAAPDDGISGTWAGRATGPEPLPPEGMPLTLKLTMAADKSVTGTLVSAVYSGAINGKFDDASQTLTLSITVGEADVTFTLKKEGNKLSGSAEAGGQTFQLTCERTGAPGATGGDKKEEDKDKPREKVEIAFDGFESRAMPLPISPGNFGYMAVNDKNQLLFARLPVGGDGAAAIKIFDLKDDKKEEKEVAAGGGSFELSADGKKVLLMRGGAGTIQDASAGSTASAKNVVTTGMTTMIDPREEWKQIFTDAWRIQRDFFYVANMHGVDWPKIKDQYARMLADCATREDVAFVLAEMISELNVGHAYVTSPGDVQAQPTVPVGMLGCDFEVADGLAGPDGAAGPKLYKISKIYTGASWDTDARGPLSQPGVDVKVGDFFLAVNGVPVDASRDPWAALQGMAGRAVTLTLSAEPANKEKSRDIVVEPLGSETSLRYRAWIESKRAYVDEKSGGKVGYIYVPNTGVDGQNDLFRQFYGQIGKEALVIDERWNGGGQIPTRFIELLNRPVTNYWARRDGKDWTWPPDSHQGPKCMLINGLAGSGGDMFPALFKQSKVGKTIGTRTWGGLVGISGNPGLIDGGYVSVPTFGFYERDGTWGIEGHGVDPDIEVIDDPAKMVSGGDPQLDTAITLMLDEVAKNPYKAAKRPADPDRKGMGIRDEDR